MSCLCLTVFDGVVQIRNNVDRISVLHGGKGICKRCVIRSHRIFCRISVSNLANTGNITCVYCFVHRVLRRCFFGGDAQYGQSDQAEHGEAKEQSAF